MEFQKRGDRSSTVPCEKPAEDIEIQVFLSGPWFHRQEFVNLPASMAISNTDQAVVRCDSGQNRPSGCPLMIQGTAGRGQGAGSRGGGRAAGVSRGRGDRHVLPSSRGGRLYTSGGSSMAQNCQSYGIVLVCCPLHIDLEYDFQLYHELVYSETERENDEKMINIKICILEVYLSCLYRKSSTPAPIKHIIRGFKETLSNPAYD